jgi:hypothetical protein
MAVEIVKDDNCEMGICFSIIRKLLMQMRLYNTMYTTSSTRQGVHSW